MPRSSGARRYAGTPRVTPYAEHAAPLPGWRHWQRVTNEQWPPGTAWLVPRAAKPIAVVALVIFELDGPTELDGLATRWTATSVLVELSDYRLGPLAVWLAPSDVRRRSS